MTDNDQTQENTTEYLPFYCHITTQVILQEPPVWARFFLRKYWKGWRVVVRATSGDRQVMVESTPAKASPNPGYVARVTNDTIRDALNQLNMAVTFTT